jgi:hypothetical protein
MMTNGAMIIAKIKEIICCLNTYCPYWLETIGLTTVTFFN